MGKTWMYTVRTTEYGILDKRSKVTTETGLVIAKDKEAAWEAVFNHHYGFEPKFYTEVEIHNRIISPCCVDQSDSES